MKSLLILLWLASNLAANGSVLGNKTTLHIMYLATWFGESSNFALDFINNRTDILPGYTLTTIDTRITQMVRTCFWYFALFSPLSLFFPLTISLFFADSFFPLFFFYWLHFCHLVPYFLSLFRSFFLFFLFLIGIVFAWKISLLAYCVHFSLHSLFYLMWGSFSSSLFQVRLFQVRLFRLSFWYHAFWVI